MNLLHQRTPESGMWCQGSFYTSLIKWRFTKLWRLLIQVEAWWNSEQLEKLASQACLKRKRGNWTTLKRRKRLHATAGSYTWRHPKRLRMNICELKETNEVYIRKRKNGSYFLGKGIKSICRITHRQTQQVKIGWDKDILHERRAMNTQGKKLFLLLKSSITWFFTQEW